MASAASELAVGSEFAGYRIDALLGQGGMGVVYLATHLRLGRKAALKVLLPGYAEDADFRERFIRESQLAASLDHPSIVPIYDANEQDGTLYLAMRYVGGHDLKHLLEHSGPLTPEAALNVAEQVGGALDAAHAAGLVHRDVKPANILIAEPGNRVYLTDFGIAKLRSAPGLTRTGTFVGTVDYCAPEQIEGKPVDARTDVYALGCVLFHSLTGQPPYPKESEVAVVHAHLLEPPPALTTRRPDLPPSLDGVIVTAMAKYPDVRYSSCGALADAFRQALQAPGPTTQPHPTHPNIPAPTTIDAPTAHAPAPAPAIAAAPVPRPSRRLRPLIAAGATLAVAGVAAAVLALTVLGNGKSTSPTTTASGAFRPPETSALPFDRIIERVVPYQERVNARMRSLRADRGSFAALVAAAKSLDRAILRAQGSLDGVSPETEADSSTKQGLADALEVQASYAAALVRLPRPAALSVARAQAAADRAGRAAEAYSSLADGAPSLPSMPISQADGSRLVSIAQRLAASNDDLRLFVDRVEALLVQSESGRTEIKQALADAFACRISAAEAGDRVMSVADNRQSLLDQLGGLTPPAAGQRASVLLQQALAHSIEADRHYRDWLSSAGGCSFAQTSNLTAAQREDALASAAKRRFVAAFNPLARKFQRRAWSDTEI